MPLPADFKDLLDPQKDRTPHKGPIYWLWVYDPMTAEVTVHNNDDLPPAHHLTHRDVAQHVTHPGRLEGYAFHIKGGYRIMDVDGKAVDDPYITEQITKALKS